MKFVDKRNELKASGSSSTLQEYFLKQNLEEQLQNSEPNDLFRRFSIDLARYTGFSRHPNSNSWEFAGASYNMREFANVVHGILYGEEKAPEQADIPTFDPLFEASDDESATGPALNPMEGEDKSLGTPVKTLKFFKPCLLKIWCDKYEADDKQAWNPTIMMDSWFLDAIKMFNSLASSVWIMEDLMTLTESSYKNLRYTVNTSWLKSLSQWTNVIRNPEVRPSTEWEQDCLKSIPRSHWIAHHSLKLLTIKNTMPKTTKKRKAATDATTFPEPKNQRSIKEIFFPVNEEKDKLIDLEIEKCDVQHGEVKKLLSDIAEQLKNQAEIQREQFQQSREQTESIVQALASLGSIFTNAIRQPANNQVNQSPGVRQLLASLEYNNRG